MDGWKITASGHAEEYQRNGGGVSTIEGPGSELYKAEKRGGKNLQAGNLMMDVSLKVSRAPKLPQSIPMFVLMNLDADQMSTSMDCI